MVGVKLTGHYDYFCASSILMISKSFFCNRKNTFRGLKLKIWLGVGGFRVPSFYTPLNTFLKFEWNWIKCIEWRSCWNISFLSFQLLEYRYTAAVLLLFPLSGSLATCHFPRFYKSLLNLRTHSILFWKYVISTKW